MHHFIYPSQDTYISNQQNYSTKNFGLDEILCVGTITDFVKSTVNTKIYSYTSSFVSNLHVENFVGYLYTGSFSGLIGYLSGSIVHTGSGTSFTTSWFSGSIDGVPYSNYYGYITSSMYIDGWVSSSLMSDCGGFSVFNGFISASEGNIDYGTINGYDVKNIQNEIVLTSIYNERLLIKFDITAISKSISNGDILSPQFKFKLKSSRAENLPISYTLYALPISQSWIMGNGYFYDGGSDVGSSWFYRDYNEGNLWYPYTSNDSTPIDFISFPNESTEVFSRGGGTWYTNIVCSQSFDYESSDVYMDVNPIVYAWLSGSIPNEGFIIITSEEISPTGLEPQLKFFSKDTNTVYEPVLDVGWDDNVWITGSSLTSSVQITSVSSGIKTNIQTDSSFISGTVYGNFSASVALNIVSNISGDIQLDFSASGIMLGVGYSGNINGSRIIGDISSSLSLLSFGYTGSCGQTSIIQSATGSIYDGVFSGSNFTANYINYQFQQGVLTGSLNPYMLSDAYVSIPIPSNIEPFSYAYISGSYINGTALGTYIPYDSTSASFNGQFIDGNFIGVNISLQLTGSVITSSYSYTSSVDFTSNELQPISFDIPFTVVVQNLKQNIKANEMIRVNIFGREKFPLKNFNRQTQFSQFLVPKYLPSSSYYSIKDNETEQIILDFDNYTKLSCDENGNYFLLDTSGLAQERYYRILIKTELNGNSYIFDNGDIFKIIR